MFKFDPNAFKANMPSASSGSFSFKFFTLNPGSNFFKILPPWSEAANGMIWYEISLHFLKDPENKTHTIRCSRKNKNFCPICDRYYSLLKSLNEEDKKLAANIRPQTRFLYNVLNDKDELFVYSAPKTVHNGIYSQIESDIRAELNPTDPDNALIINVIKKGSGFNTEYTVSSERRRAKFPNAIREAKLTELNTIFPDFSIDDLNKIMSGDFSVKNKYDESVKFDPEKLDNTLNNDSNNASSVIVSPANNTSSSSSKSTSAKSLLDKVSSME